MKKIKSIISEEKPEPFFEKWVYCDFTIKKNRAKDIKRFRSRKERN